MINLFKHEFFKLKRNKAVKVVFIIALAFTLLLTVLNLAGKNKVKGVLSLEAAAQQSQLWVVLFSVLISSIVVGDYNRGVVRNLVMSGQNRHKIYLVKLIVSFAVCLAIFLSSFLIFAAFFGFANGWGSADASKYIVSWLIILLELMAVVSLTVFFADLTKNTGAAIGITLGAMVLFVILWSMGEGLVRSNPSSTVGKILKYFGDLHAGNNMVGTSQYSGENAVSAAKMIKYTVVGFVTLISTTAGGLILFKRRELK